jgi:hypothetical protein
MEFQVRVQNVIQLLAFVSNGSRLSRCVPGARRWPERFPPCSQFIDDPWYSTEIRGMRKLRKEQEGTLHE